MNLTDAIVSEIKEQKVFSAHQITKKLREKVNNKKIKLDNVVTITLPTGEVVQNILHNVVKTYIQDLTKKQVLPLSAKIGNKFITYSLNTTKKQVSPVKKKSKVVPSAINSWSTTARHLLYKRVATYVCNKRKNKETITVRGISGIVKTKGIKISDIIDICNKLQYTVVQKTPKYKSEVK